MIFSVLGFKLHRSHCRQSIVDIIEWIEINMQFMIPVTATVKEIICLIFSPRHISFFQLLPCKRALLRCHIRVAVTDMLEFIYGYAKRYKCQGILQVCKTIFICLLSKEFFCIRISKLFHRHGMDLCNIRGFAVICCDRLAAHCHISCKRMA